MTMTPEQMAEINPRDFANNDCDDCNGTGWVSGGPTGPGSAPQQVYGWCPDCTATELDRVTEERDEFERRYYVTTDNTVNLRKYNEVVAAILHAKIDALTDEEIASLPNPWMITYGAGKAARTANPKFVPALKEVIR